MTINDPTQRLFSLIKGDPEYYNNDRRLPLATWSEAGFYFNCNLWLGRKTVLINLLDFSFSLGCYQWVKYLIWPT